MSTRRKQSENSAPRESVADGFGVVVGVCCGAFPETKNRV